MVSDITHTNSQENLLEALKYSLQLLSRWKCRGFSCSSESIATLTSWNTTSEKRSMPQLSEPKPAPLSDSMDQIQSEAANCDRCPLCADRNHVLFGQGNVNARLLLIGSMPNSEEDRTGNFYSDKSGELLLKIIGAMNLNPDQIYMTNIVKCRPQNGRLPTAEEIQTCRTYWQRQIKVVNPDVICCLGEPAAKTILDEDESIDDLRGRFYSKYNCRIMPTLSPEYLLHTPGAKRLVWEDVKKIMAYLGIPRQ